MINEKLEVYLQHLLTENVAKSIFYGKITNGIPDWIYLWCPNIESTSMIDSKIDFIIDTEYSEDDFEKYPFVLMGTEEPKMEPAYLLRR